MQVQSKKTSTNRLLYARLYARVCYAVGGRLNDWNGSQLKLGALFYNFRKGAGFRRQPVGKTSKNWTVKQRHAQSHSD